MNAPTQQKSLRYVEGPRGFFAAFRVPIGIFVGLVVAYNLFNAVGPLPSNGEIGFLGLLPIIQFVSRVGSVFVGLALGVAIVAILKRLGMEPCPPGEGDE